MFLRWLVPRWLQCQCRRPAPGWQPEQDLGPHNVVLATLLQQSIQACTPSQLWKHLTAMNLANDWCSDVASLAPSSSSETAWRMRVIASRELNPNLFRHRRCSCCPGRLCVGDGTQKIWTWTLKSWIEPSCSCAARWGRSVTAFHSGIGGVGAAPPPTILSTVERWRKSSAGMLGAKSMGAKDLMRIW